MTLFNN